MQPDHHKSSHHLPEILPGIFHGMMDKYLVDQINITFIIQYWKADVYKDYIAYQEKKPPTSH